MLGELCLKADALTKHAFVVVRMTGLNTHVSRRPSIDHAGQIIIVIWITIIIVIIRLIVAILVTVLILVIVIIVIVVVIVIIIITIEPKDLHSTICHITVQPEYCVAELADATAIVCHGSQPPRLTSLAWKLATLVSSKKLPCSVT